MFTLVVVAFKWTLYFVGATCSCCHSQEAIHRYHLQRGMHCHPQEMLLGL